MVSEEAGQMMKEIKRTTFKVYNNVGEEISFADYVKEFGEPDIYQKDFEEIIKAWRHADWIYTDEYIAPLASQIITDACELDPEMYAEIMTAIEKAFEKISPIANPNYLHRVK